MQDEAVPIESVLKHSKRVEGWLTQRWNVSGKTHGHVSKFARIQIFFRNSIGRMLKHTKSASSMEVINDYVWDVRSDGEDVLVTLLPPYPQLSMRFTRNDSGSWSSELNAGDISKFPVPDGVPSANYLATIVRNAGDSVAEYIRRRDGNEKE